MFWSLGRVTGIDADLVVCPSAKADPPTAPISDQKLLCRSHPVAATDDAVLVFVFHAVVAIHGTAASAVVLSVPRAVMIVDWLTDVPSADVLRFVPALAVTLPPEFCIGALSVVLMVPRSVFVDVI